MRVPREIYEGFAQVWEKLPPSMRRCPDCGRVLSGPVQDAWPENEKEAWAYVNCPRCGEIALWKVERKRRTRREEL